jgi:two-component system sensor histidine kinase/response regulator
VNRKVAVLLLERLGYRVDVAANGREALERLADADYRAILMDCQMPELDGYEATAVIRSQERGGARIPIIAMTANAMAGDRERCLAAGMDDYVSKPIQLAMLAQVLARWAPAGSPPVEPDGQPDLPGLRRELAGLFLEDAPARLAELEEAHRQGDREAIRRAAHQLKGTAATVGAAEVAKSAAELETMARSAGLEAAPEVLARLRTELDRVRRAAP